VGPDLYAAILQGDFGINTAFSLSYLLIGRAAAGYPSNDTTDAMVYNLAGYQSDRGAYLSESHRPPLEDSAVTATALASRALTLFGPEGRSQEIEEKLRRARNWLEAVAPSSNEERAMRLLGLGWTGASDRSIREAAEDLSHRQRPDGGWAQIATLESDAYATGQALVSLQQMGGLSVDSEVYRSGVRFLLETQWEDGSWLVETRRRGPGIPYFDAGFPHKMHQFISFAGTAWATMALCLTIEPGPSDVFHGERPARDASDTFAEEAGMQSVHLAAAYGSQEDLRRALADDAASANAAGPGGLTPLMLAVHDESKVDLLLGAGAEIETKTDSQFTALTLAGWYAGAGRSLDRLLDGGASMDFAASDGALVRAARTGESQKVLQLLDHGADIEAAFPDGRTALLSAVIAGDLELLQLLLDRDAAIEATWEGDMTALIVATYAGWTDLVERLIDQGADLDATDETGMTALAWASKIDHGHGDIASRLLTAGADHSIESKSGRTALDWAEEFDNRAVAELLRRHREAIE
jgi:ankyrin repeat protein